MNRTPRWVTAIAITASLISPAEAAPPSPGTAVSPALTVYLEGLDALHDGRAADAIGAFSRAMAMQRELPAADPRADTGVWTDLDGTKYDIRRQR